MIKEQELRLGNLILQKVNNRISMVPCTFDHFDLIAKGNGKDIYPVILKAEVLEKCGFKENKDYPLAPSAREFILALPISGSNKNEIFAYIKSNGECFGRATVNGLPASNNFYHLHQLQNLYFILTGEELGFKK